MVQLVFLGFGNVNYHLYNALYNAGNVTVKQIYSRYNKAAFGSIPFTTDLSKLEEADVYIIGIPDDAITSFSEALPFKDRLVVHTSGAAGMEVLSEKNRRGVLYPLQTFSAKTPLAYETIPVCIEAGSAEDLRLLRTLAGAFSSKVVEIPSEIRARLHLAAVFVNNFVNHLYHISETLLAADDLDLSLLKPLIEETARKIQTLSPAEAQTGPARRNDLKTIEKHLHLLKEGPNRALYARFTEAIQNTYGKKL